MAHYTLQAGAPGLPLTPGMVLKLEAQNPGVDAAVSGVTSGRWSIYGYDASAPPPQRIPPPILRPSTGR